jgi:hypothetical protein
MPSKVWSTKRERQYRHVKERKDSLLAHGDRAPLAEEIAARLSVEQGTVAARLAGLDEILIPGLSRPLQ